MSRLLPLTVIAAVTLLAGSARAIDASSLKQDGLVSAAWYAGWHSTQFPVDKIPWTKYTHVSYAFAVTTDDGKSMALDESDAAILPDFVAKAHENDVKVTLSIGGWGGSKYFSSNVGSSEKRTSFVKTILDAVQEYNLDGVDFDWEYPNKQGLGCNTINGNDTANLLSLLQELRNSSSSSPLLITAATFGKPFNDKDGLPLKDVSAFANIFDFIAIMNYDIWTYLSNGTKAGPTSPLDDSCASGGVGSAVSALKSWTEAGFPADKIVLGVPAYGHSFDVSPSNALNGDQLALYPAVNKNRQPIGDKWDGEGEDSCGVNQGYSGVYNYWSLYDEGFLASNGSANEGISYVFDECSQTPYVYNATSQIMVSYDNEQSFAAKGNFVHEHGLKGFAIWEMAGDYEDRLLDSILNAVVYGNGSGSDATPAAGTQGDDTDSALSIAAFIPSYCAIALLSVLSLQ